MMALVRKGKKNECKLHLEPETLPNIPTVLTFEDAENHLSRLNMLFFLGKLHFCVDHGVIHCLSLSIRQKAEGLGAADRNSDEELRRKYF